MTARRLHWRNKLTGIVARHAISEELTWYPAMEKILGKEGVRLSKPDKEKHLMACLHSNLIPSINHSIISSKITTPGEKKLPQPHPRYDVDKPEFGALLDISMDFLLHHIEHEKNGDMPPHRRSPITYRGRRSSTAVPADEDNYADAEPFQYADIVCG